MARRKQTLKKLDYSIIGAVDVVDTETGVKHIIQPNNSYICGQCSIAMATGNDLKTVLDAFGHSTFSNTKETLAALKKLGYTYASYRDGIDNRKPIEFEGYGVARIQVRGRNMGHMVAYKDGIIYDPAGYIFHSAKELRANYKARHHRAWTVDYIMELKEEAATC